MNTTQLTALCQRYQAILLDADNEVVHIAVVDAPSHELLDALHFATTRRIDIVCWTRQPHTYTADNAPGSGHEKQRQRSRLAESDVSFRPDATGF